MNLKDKEEIKSYLDKRNIRKKINFLLQKYKNKRIVLYGAGLFCSVIMENYDLSALNVVGLADYKFNSEECSETYPFKTVSNFKIAELKPDVIVITAYNYIFIKNFIIENIFPEIGEIPVEHIISKNFIEKIQESFSNWLKY